ncbi:hypothetical protein M2447_001275 [Ereboglobus sp. PH5-10]|nr:hypothetical protein [Ereboglobus sp. PH5-10]
MDLHGAVAGRASGAHGVAEIIELVAGAGNLGGVGAGVVAVPELDVAAGEAAGFHAADVGAHDEVGDVLLEARAGVFGGHAEFFRVLRKGVEGDEGVGVSVVLVGEGKEVGDALDFFAGKLGRVVDVVGDLVALGGEGVEVVEDLEALGVVAEFGDFGGRGDFAMGERADLEAGGGVAEVGLGGAGPGVANGGGLRDALGANGDGVALDRGVGLAPAGGVGDFKPVGRGVVARGEFVGVAKGDDGGVALEADFRRRRRVAFHLGDAVGFVEGEARRQ